MHKTEWDVYFLTMAYLASIRSIDTSTKCGCILVSKDHRVLSSGYNGPIKGMNDKDVPMTRPEKYYYMIHSEINALLAYGGSHSDIQEGTAYITSQPCHDCLRSLLQKGIRRIVYCDVNHAKCIRDMEDSLKKAHQDMIEQISPEIVIISPEQISEALLLANSLVTQKGK